LFGQYGRGKKSRLSEYQSGGVKCLSGDHYKEGKMVVDKKIVWMSLGIFFFIGGLPSGHSWAEDIKVGSVDIQKAVNECRGGREDKQAITKEVEKYQLLAIEKQKELQQMKDSLEKQWLMLNPETRVAKEKEYQAKLRDFQRWGQDAENEINQKRIEMERQISIGLQKVIQKVGMDEGYTLILEKNENIVFFTSKFIDITDRVIKAYDAQKK
jgi:outer membrane protein